MYVLMSACLYDSRSATGLWCHSLPLPKTLTRRCRVLENKTLKFGVPARGMKTAPPVSARVPPCQRGVIIYVIGGVDVQFLNEDAALLHAYIYTAVGIYM